MNILKNLITAHKGEGETVFSGADAFKLYDTYGFPIDLTIEMVAEQGLSVDQDGFRSLMEEQKIRLPVKPGGSGRPGLDGIEFARTCLRRSLWAIPTRSTDGKVLAIVSGDELRDEVAAGAEASWCCGQDHHVRRDGGQVADHGVISNDGCTFEVRDVQKKRRKYMHYGVVKSGVLKVGDGLHLYQRDPPQGGDARPLRNPSAG